MGDDYTKIEQQMQRMRKLFLQIGDFIDKLPDVIPIAARKKIKDLIFGDKELKALMDGVEAHRPPRFFIIGRTGVGKSSLINALCGTYVAKVCDTRSCTAGISTYNCMEGDRVIMEICDTRGIAESESLDDSVSAEEMLVQQINEFSPDAAIFMLNCTHRDDVKSDALFLQKLATAYNKVNGSRLPIVVVINKSDEMAPARIKDPSEYTPQKIDKINEVIQYYKGIIMKSGLEFDDIIAVSSLIDWQTSDGVEITVEDIDNLPKNDIDKLEIAFDGRYHIEELIDILEKAILDYEAQMGLRMAVRLAEVIKRLANHLNGIFSGIAAAIATTPIPVSDIYLLLILQTVLVCLIAVLGGRDMSWESAREFVLSLGGVVGLGNGFKLAAQQASKLIPGAGSVISAAIAWVGTAAIGKGAIAYYIDGATLAEAKKKFETEQKVDKSVKD